MSNYRTNVTMIDDLPSLDDLEGNSGLSMIPSDNANQINKFIRNGYQPPQESGMNTRKQQPPQQQPQQPQQQPQALDRAEAAQETISQSTTTATTTGGGGGGGRGGGSDSSGVFLRDVGGTIDDMVNMNFEGICLDEDAQYGKWRDGPVMMLLSLSLRQ